MIDYEEFRCFLREQGCETNFDRAFYAYNHATLLDLALWEAYGDQTHIFASSFRWGDTLEGADFWREVDKRWIKRVESIDSGRC